MAQLLVEGGEPERNLARAKKLIEQAAKERCDLVILPETCDFGWTHPSALVEASPLPSRWSEQIQEMAQKYQIHLCFGLTEKDAQTKKNFNSALLIDDCGRILLSYRKINLLEVEFPYYEVGQSLGVAQTKWGKIGLNICSDNYQDSTVIGHTLARMGAQIILSPSSWTVTHSISEEDDPYGDKWMAPHYQLCSLYGIAMISTTSVGYIVGGPYEGKKMVGCSLAVGPNGIIAQGPFNEVAGDLISFELEVPTQKQRGVPLTEMIRKKGLNLSPSQSPSQS